jgi:hypothetical protein
VTDAARQRARAAAELASGRRTSQLLAALSHWHRVVAGEARRRAAIKVCITAKRVTMHWFLQWYWEAYDDEIRSTLQMLMGTCDDTLHDLYTAHLPGTQQHLLSSQSIFHVRTPQLLKHSLPACLQSCHC